MDGDEDEDQEVNMEVEDLASDDDDFLEQEDDELAAEGARILAEIEAEHGA